MEHDDGIQQTDGSGGLHFALAWMVNPPSWSPFLLLPLSVFALIMVAGLYIAIAVIRSLVWALAAVVLLGGWLLSRVRRA
jgi:hypothetical protein